MRWTSDVCTSRRSVAVRGRAPVDATKEADIFEDRSDDEIRSAKISLPEVGQDVAVAVEFWATTAGDRIMTRRWHGSLWTRSGYSLYSKCRKTAAQF